MSDARFRDSHSDVYAAEQVARDGTGRRKELMRRIQVIALTTAIASHAFAQPGTLNDTITGPGSHLSNFGHAVAIDGEWLVVGAPLEVTAGNKGKVYIYRRGPTGWALDTCFVASQPNSTLGISVAVQSEGPSKATVAAGAHFQNVGGLVQAGAVYIYEWNGTQWSEAPGPLAATPVVGNELFGICLALQDDTLVVGASNGSPPGGAGQRGAVYVFDRPPGGSFTQTTLLDDPAGNMFDRFGTDVAIHGNRIAVGAPGANQGSASDAGRVYVFTSNGSWGQQPAVVQPPSPQTSGLFGGAVAIEETRLYVGSHGHSMTNGIAYVFDLQPNGSWGHLATLNPPPAPMAEFGVEIAVRDGLVAIGAYMDEKVYLFREANGVWYQPFGPLTPPMPADDFGLSIDFSDDEIAVGARLAGPPMNKTGKVFIYDADPFFPTYGDGCPSSCGSVPIHMAAGAYAQGGSITFFVDQAPFATPVFWLIGVGTSSAPVNASCMVDILPLAVTIPVFLSSSTPCEFDTTYTVTVPVGFPLPPCITSQIVCVDPLVGGGYSISNAVKIQ